MKKLFLLIGLVVFSFSAKSEEYFCESKKNGNVYKSPVGCFNNITLTEEEFLSKSDKLIEYTSGNFFYCEKKGSGEQYLGWDGALHTAYWKIYSNTTGCDSSSLSITKYQYTKKSNENFTRGMESMKNKPEIHYCDNFPNASICENYKKPLVFKKKEASFDEFATSLGCSKSKDVDDCVRRYLPSLLGSTPMTMDQINEVKKDKELMGEIVFAVEEINRRLSESFEPSLEQQARAQKGQGGVYVEQGGEWVWVDLRYEKYVDRSGRWHALNPAQKSFVTGYKIRTGYHTPPAFGVGRVSLPTGTIWGPVGQFLGFKTPTSRGYYFKK